jgi:hypothetical protein
MSIRFGTPLIASSIVFGLPGLGVRGDAVPSTGDNGGSILWGDFTLPTYAGNEFRALILTTPPGGSAFFFEDGSGIFSGYPDGVYSGTYRGLMDGTAYAPDPQTYTFTVGAAEVTTLSPRRNRRAGQVSASAGPAGSVGTLSVARVRRAGTVSVARLQVAAAATLGARRKRRFGLVVAVSDVVTPVYIPAPLHFTPASRVQVLTSRDRRVSFTSPARAN